MNIRFFTLLELLLVTIILALVASTAMLAIDSGDDQLTAETAGSSVINLNYQHRRQLCKILSCRLSRVFCNNSKLEE